MNLEKYIYLKSNSIENLVQTIESLAEVYADSRYVKLVSIFQDQKQTDTFVLNFLDQPDFEMMRYFVNFLCSPEYSSFIKIVLGYQTVKELGDIQWYNPGGERLMIYVSPEDKKGDYVSLSLHNFPQTIFCPFEVGKAMGLQDDMERDFWEPEIIEKDYLLIHETSKMPGQPVYENQNATSGCLEATIVRFFVLIWIVNWLSP